MELLRSIKGGDIILSYLDLCGFNSDDFVESELEILPTDDGYLIEATQKKANFCPLCGSTNVYVHDHHRRVTNIKHSHDSIIHLVINMTRCRCNDCFSSFTPKLQGIEKYSKISNFAKAKIIESCKKVISFKAIAEENLTTRMRVIQIFDETFPYVEALPLPEVMCLDEIRFFTDYETKYILIITNFLTGEIVDILPSRKMDVMKEYFSSRYSQLKNVKYLVTDMYEGFNTLHQSFFRNIPHIIDLFHVIEDLSRAVNKIRTEVMKKELDGSGAKAFMKSHWKLFLARFREIPNEVLYKKYCNERTNVEKDYYSWMQECLNLDRRFYTAYRCLQEMYDYSKFSTYEEGENHLNRIIGLLESTFDDELLKVAETYRKNFVGIVNCLDKKTKPYRFTTGIAENVNNHIRTIIKVCYGCTNFERFRKRILLISRFKKMDRKPGAKVYKRHYF